MGTEVPPRKAFIYDHAVDAALDIWIRYVAAELAKYMKIGEDELIRHARINTERIFGIPWGAVRPFLLSFQAPLGPGTDVCGLPAEETFYGDGTHK